MRDGFPTSIARAPYQIGYPSGGPVINLTTSAVKFLDPPGTAQPRLVHLSVVNYTSTARLFSLHYIASGGSVASTNKIQDFEVNGNDTVNIPTFPLVDGYELHAVAAASSALSLFCWFEELE